MRILAIETANPPGSLALSVDGELRAKQFVSARRTTEIFATAIQELLAAAQISPKDIGVVCTTLGPGSFTGLRIGITAAKVFAHAVDARMIAVNTLEVIAHQAENDGEIEAVLDAQRGELFAARFRRDGDTFEQMRATQIVSADEWLATSATDATLIGTGLKKIRDKLPADANVADESLWAPNAQTLIPLAEEKLEAGDVTTPLTLVPQYFRRSAAEEKADNA